MNNNNFEREKEVKVKSLTGREHEYVFEKESKPTLRMLKDMVQDHEGIPINQQRFMIISEDEEKTLPYKDSKINTFVKENEHRYLKGNTKELAELGVNDGSILLLVLTLRGTGEDDENDPSPSLSSSEPPADPAAKRLEELDSKVVFEDYKLTVAEVNELLEQLKNEKSNKEAIGVLCRILRSSYTFNSTTMSNTRAVEEMIPLLENVTDLEIAADYINVFSGIARSKIDGIIVKMIELGVFKSIKRILESSSQNKFVLSSLQEDIINFLENCQREHEPCNTEVATLIYKDNFEKNELITVADYIGYNLEGRLWGEPLAYYTANQTNEADFLITLIEVSGLDLAPKDKNGLSDPYFEAGPSPGYNETFKPQIKSSVQKKTLNPVWKMKSEKKISFIVPHGTTATILLYDQDMIKDEFMGSITFDPASLYAIQQKGKSKPCESITYSMKVESIERKKKDVKIHDVCGYLVVNLHIGHVKK